MKNNCCSTSRNRPIPMLKSGQVRVGYLVYVFCSVFMYNLISAEELYIKLTFPTPDLLKSELTYDKIRFAGVTIPAAKVKYTRKSEDSKSETELEVKVYSSGAFVGLIELTPGKNSFEFTAQVDTFTIKQTMTILKKKPVPFPPPDVLKIDISSLEPGSDRTLVSGDILTVKCRGTPNAKVNFYFGTDKKSYPMTELTGNKKGNYVGHYVIQPTDEWNNVTIRFTLTTTAGTVEETASGKVSVLPAYLTRTVVISEPYGLLLTELDLSRAYTFTLPKGTKLPVCGQEGDYVYVKLTDTSKWWIAKKQVDFLPLGTPPPSSFVYGITVSTISSRITRIYISLSERVPFTVEEFIVPSAMEMTIYGTVFDTGWTTQYLENKIVKHIKLTPLSNNVSRVRVDLNLSQMWGYDVWYEGDTMLVWEIKGPPSIKTEPGLFGSKPDLTGLTVFIDPGHGGSDKGAIGATGLEEKTVNLDMSTELADLLRKTGTTVVMAREEDKEISWQERFKLARENKADIYLCMHNNSIPDDWDPLRARGVSTFYGYPSGQELVKILFTRLSGIGLNPMYYIYRHPYRNQPTNLIFVLVEAAFICHPEDEILLLDSGFRKKIGTAVYDGLVEFINKIN